MSGTAEVGSEQVDTISLAADVVGAYVSNNSLRAEDLPGLITSVHQALQALLSPPEPEPIRLEPAIPIRKSITPDALISLEDGRPYKTLRRHLARRGLTPDQYRTKWGLAKGYPMVAPNYAARRSELALRLGLGRKAALASDQTMADQTPDPAGSPAVNAPADSPPARKPKAAAKRAAPASRRKSKAE